MSDIHQVIANKVSQTISQEDASKQFQSYLTSLKTALGNLSTQSPDISAIQISLLPLLIVLDHPNCNAVKEVAFQVALTKAVMPHLDNDGLLDRFQTKPTEKPKSKSKKFVYNTRED